MKQETEVQQWRLAFTDHILPNKKVNTSYVAAFNKTAVTRRLRQFVHYHDWGRVGGPNESTLFYYADLLTIPTSSG